MTDVESIPTDERTRKAIVEGAALARMSPERYLRFIVENGRAPGAVNPTDVLSRAFQGSGSGGGEDPLMRIILLKIAMPEAFDGQRRRGDDVEEVVERVLARSGIKSGGADEVHERLRKRLAERAELKLLQKDTDEDPDTRKYIDTQIQTLNKQITEERTIADKREAELKAQIARKEQDEKEEKIRHDRQAFEERVMGAVADNQSAIIEFMKTGGKGGGTGGTDDPITTVTKSLQALNGLRDEIRKGDPQPKQAPGETAGWEQKVGYLLDKASEAGQSILEGAGAVVAAKHGHAPNAPDRLPTPAGTTVQPEVYTTDYQLPPLAAAAPPRVPRAASPPAAPAGPVPEIPADILRRLPVGATYVDDQTGTPISRDAWIQKNRAEIIAHPERIGVATPEPPAPPSAPAEEPPAPQENRQPGHAPPDDPDPGAAPPAEAPPPPEDPDTAAVVE